jgi:hypothetical protein
MMLVLLLIDHACGPEVSPWVAYAVPIILASRYCGFSTGAAYAILAAALVWIAARNSGHPYSSEALFLIAVSWQTLALLVIAWLSARLSTVERKLTALSA